MSQFRCILARQHFISQLRYSLLARTHQSFNRNLHTKYKFTWAQKRPVKSPRSSPKMVKISKNFICAKKKMWSILISSPIQEILLAFLFNRQKHFLLRTQFSLQKRIVNRPLPTRLLTAFLSLQTEQLFSSQEYMGRLK